MVTLHGSSPKSLASHPATTFCLYGSAYSGHFIWIRSYSKYVAFCDWLLSLGMVFKAHSFYGNNIPMHRYTTFIYPFIHPLMDIWFVSTFWLSWITLLWKCVYTYPEDTEGWLRHLCKGLQHPQILISSGVPEPSPWGTDTQGGLYVFLWTRFPFLLGRYLRVSLLDHMVILLHFSRNCQAVFQKGTIFHFHQQCVEGSNFSTSLSTLICPSLLFACFGNLQKKTIRNCKLKCLWTVTCLH